MEDYKKRLIEEYKELGERLIKLSNNLSNKAFKKKIGKTQYKLMCTQNYHLTIYWNTLRERMDNLGIKTEEYDI